MLSPATVSEARSSYGVLAALWGVSGFVALLGVAIVRLFSLATDSLGYPWGVVHYAVFAVNVVFMGYTEGYKGFQRSYSPRFAARILHLYRYATAWQALFAPFVAMGFVNATRRRLRVAWLLTVGIVGIVLVYRMLPQPWRGILDAGVVLGLSWGLVATVASVWAALQHGSDVDPEFG